MGNNRDYIRHIATTPDIDINRQTRCQTNGKVDAKFPPRKKCRTYLNRNKNGEVVKLEVNIDR